MESKREESSGNQKREDMADIRTPRAFDHLCQYYSKMGFVIRKAHSFTWARDMRFVPAKLEIEGGLDIIGEKDGREIRVILLYGENMKANMISCLKKLPDADTSKINVGFVLPKKIKHVPCVNELLVDIQSDSKFCEYLMFSYPFLKEKGLNKQFFKHTNPLEMRIAIIHLYYYFERYFVRALEKSENYIDFYENFWQKSRFPLEMITNALVPNKIISKTQLIETFLLTLSTHKQFGINETKWNDSLTEEGYLNSFRCPQENLLRLKLKKLQSLLGNMEKKDQRYQIIDSFVTKKEEHVTKALTSAFYAIYNNWYKIEREKILASEKRRVADSPFFN